MSTYQTFLRSCTNWLEFANAEKTTVETGLTQEQAYAACREFNANRTEEEKLNGTKLEFTEESP